MKKKPRQDNFQLFWEKFSFEGCGGLCETDLFFGGASDCLLGAGVLGDGFGSLRHSVLGQLTGQEETDGSLDLSAGDGGATVVVGQTGGLGSDALEDVVDKAVHDGHSLAGDTSVGVHLLQHLVDVDGVRLPPPPLPLLVPGTGGLCLGGGLLSSLRRYLGWHVECSSDLSRLSNARRTQSFYISHMQISGLWTPFLTVTVSS